MARMKYRNPDTGEFVELLDAGPQQPDRARCGRPAPDRRGHRAEERAGRQGSATHAHTYADLPADVARTGYVDTGDAAAEQYADTQDDAHSTADRAFTTAGLATKVGEAPSDGNGYVRKNAGWALESGGGGGGGDLPGVTVVEGPGIDPTGVTDSAAGIRAIFNSAPQGQTLLFPRGTYRLDSGIVLQDQAQTVDASNATFDLNHDGHGFRFSPSWDAVIDVTAYTVEADSTLTQGAETTMVQKMTLASAPSWKVGDPVKLIANDSMSFCAPNNGHPLRSGETAQVVNISGSQVWLGGEMRQPFTTNIRAARLPRSRLVWRGGIFIRNDAYMKGTGTGTGNGASALYLEGAYRPHLLKVRVKRNSNAAITLSKCYQAELDECEIDYTEDFGGMYGYGVVDSGQGTRIRGLRAGRVRHAYATGGGFGVQDGNADDNPLHYGAVTDVEVTGDCEAPTQAAWDTHGDAWGVKFINCTTQNGWSGYGLRGIENQILGGEVRRVPFERRPRHPEQHRELHLRPHHQGADARQLQRRDDLVLLGQGRSAGVPGRHRAAAHLRLRRGDQEPCRLEQHPQRHVGDHQAPQRGLHRRLDQGRRGRHRGSGGAAGRCR